MSVHQEQKKKEEINNFDSFKYSSVFSLGAQVAKCDIYYNEFMWILFKVHLN